MQIGFCWSPSDLTRILTSFLFIERYSKCSKLTGLGSAASVLDSELENYRNPKHTHSSLITHSNPIEHITPHYQYMIHYSWLPMGYIHHSLPIPILLPSGSQTWHWCQKWSFKWFSHVNRGCNGKITEYVWSIFQPAMFHYLRLHHIICLVFGMILRVGWKSWWYYLLGIYAYICTYTYTYIHM